jgi:dTDP-4-amino-4,6-dideoxygalactose transaminase
MEETEKVAAEILSLPIYPELEETELHSIVASIREFWERYND